MVVGPYLEGHGKHQKDYDYLFEMFVIGKGKDAYGSLFYQVQRVYQRYYIDGYEYYIDLQEDNIGSLPSLPGVPHSAHALFAAIEDASVNSYSSKSSRSRSHSANSQNNSMRSQSSNRSQKKNSYNSPEKEAVDEQLLDKAMDDVVAFVAKAVPKKKSPSPKKASSPPATYVMYKKQKYVVKLGKRGGKYILVGDKKIYLKA